MKVLLVEDYEPLRKAVTKAIREMGWAVEAVGDGEEGLWYVRNHPVDVMLLDVMLPKLSGLELLTQLREGGDDIPVLLLTARDSLEDRVAGLDLGADDYLVKPFFMGELLSRLKALVRRRYPQKNPVIRVGALVIDTNARRVKLKGAELELTAREYSLLEYLARRKGQVVSRAEIWDHVYESYGGAGSNVVDVYIGYLRKKIHQPGQRKYILTKRGQGYILQEKRA